MKVSLSNKRKKARTAGGSSHPSSENGDEWIFGHFDDEDEDEGEGSASYPIAMIESDD